MAKRKQATEAATGKENGQPGGETVSGYFRRVFGENPKWLKTRSNDDGT
jgi:type IV secretory pathway VirB9-like protein